jgi:hypothetical protein
MENGTSNSGTSNGHWFIAVPQQGKKAAANMRLVGVKKGFHRKKLDLWRKKRGWIFFNEQSLFWHVIHYIPKNNSPDIPPLSFPTARPNRRWNPQRKTWRGWMSPLFSWFQFGGLKPKPWKTPFQFDFTCDYVMHFVGFLMREQQQFSIGCVLKSPGAVGCFSTSWARFTVSVCVWKWSL